MTESREEERRREQAEYHKNLDDSITAYNEDKILKNANIDMCDCDCHRKDYPAVFEFMSCCAKMGDKYINEDGTIDSAVWFKDTLKKKPKRKRTKK